MNNPIINPVLFYLADTAGGLKFLFIIISILLLFISFIFFMEKGLCKKYCIGSAILLIILGILIPSKETCYKMAIAKYVTPHNIEIVSEYVNDVASSVGLSLIHI